MRRLLNPLLLIVLVSAALSSCGTTTTPSLYYWGGSAGNGASVYEDLTYMDYKTQSAEAVCKLVCAYENMISNPGGTRKVPPPGICAEYGYLLLQPETATIFTENASDAQRKYFEGTEYANMFFERGQEVLKMELELYPESRKFLEPLIKRWTAK